MEEILKQINAVIGVTGAFVYTVEGGLVAKAISDDLDAASLDMAARVASQTIGALEMSGKRVTEADLLFGQGRLILKNLRGGILVILCSRAINVPLLNLTANLAVKKLTTELKLARSPMAEAVSKPVASSAPPPSSPVPRRKVITSPLFLELDQEIHRLMDAAREAHVTLRVLNSLAIWLCCPNTHTLLAKPEKRQIEMAALSTERDSIVRLFEQAGYRSDEPVDASHASRRLRLIGTQSDLNVDLFFDVLEMDYRLDLKPFLAQEGTTISETALLLIRLQTVELNDATLREICALLLEHEVSMDTQAGKINIIQIAELGVTNSNLGRTISKNLDLVTSFAATVLTSSDQAIVAERGQRLKQIINTGLLRILSHSRSTSSFAR